MILPQLKLELLGALVLDFDVPFGWQSTLFARALTFTVAVFVLMDRVVGLISAGWTSGKRSDASASHQTGSAQIV